MLKSYIYNIIYINMKIYILRHERRHSNPNFDTSLTEYGLENANTLSDILENLNIDTIYCSPFKRIIQTIEPFLKKTGKKVNIENSLYEYINSDEFSQDDVRDINENMYGYKYFNLNYKSFYDINNLKYPEGKTRLKLRTHNFINKLKSFRKSNENILLVSHMTPIHTILDFKLERMYPQGGLSLIYYNGDVFNKINF